jgi:hypothetical protein
MSNLEKFIKENRSEFDDKEPSTGHFERFAARLDDGAVSRSISQNRPQMLKIAALILLLISVSAIVFDFGATQIRQGFSSASGNNEIQGEFKDAILYYESESNEQLAVLGNLTHGKKEAGEISGSVLTDIKNLDATTVELKKALDENPGNERIQEAIIQNQQMKNTILNTVIDRLKNKTEY